MKEDRSEKNGLICVIWATFLEVASDLGANSLSELKSVAWFTSSHEGDESTALLRDMNVAKKEETGTRIFSSYQEGEDWWQ